MKIIFGRIIFVLLILFSLLFLFGCTNTITTKQTKTSTENVTESQTPAQVNTVSTQTPSLEVESATLESGELEVATMVPTITANEIFTMIKENSIISSDCRFPCVWGFTPVDRNMADIAKLMKEIGPNDENNIDIDCNYMKNVNDIMVGYYADNISFQYRLSDLLLPTGEFISIDIISNESIYENYFDDYQIHSIIEMFGNPSDIFIGVYPSNYPEPIPRLFDLILFYPDVGFLVEYSSLLLDDETYIAGCLHDTDDITIITWNPQKDKSIEDIISEFDRDYWRQMDIDSFKFLYKNIENSMTVEDFVNMILDPNNHECVRVPKKDWNHE